MEQGLWLSGKSIRRSKLEIRCQNWNLKTAFLRIGEFWIQLKSAWYHLYKLDFQTVILSGHTLRKPKDEEEINLFVSTEYKWKWPSLTEEDNIWFYWNMCVHTYVPPRQLQLQRNTNLLTFVQRVFQTDANYI